MVFKMSIKMLKLFFFLIGLIYVILKIGVWGLVSVMPDDKNDLSVKSFPSPDGNYIADVVEISGGGAISPFCSDLVAIRPRSIFLKTYEDYGRYQVYSDGCDSFGDAPSPKVNWAGNKTVEITFATRSARTFSRKISIKSLDESSQVGVKFISE